MSAGEFETSPEAWTASGLNIGVSADDLAAGADQYYSVLAGAGQCFGNDTLGWAAFYGDGTSQSPGFKASRDDTLTGLAAMVNVLRDTGAGLVTAGAHYAHSDEVAARLATASTGKAPFADTSTPAAAATPEIYRLPALPDGPISPVLPPVEWTQATGLLESVGLGFEWPNGSPALVRSIRDASNDLADHIDATRGGVARHAGVISATGSGAATDSFAAFAGDVYGDNGSLADLATRCRGLAAHCDVVARTIDAARWRFWLSVMFVLASLALAPLLNIDEAALLRLLRAEAQSVRAFMVVCLKQVLVGAYLSGGLDAIGQWARIHEGLQDTFDVQELMLASAQGGIAGLLMGGTHAGLTALTRRYASLAGFARLMESRDLAGAALRVGIGGTVATGAMAATDAIFNGKVDWEHAIETGYGMALFGAVGDHVKGDPGHGRAVPGMDGAALDRQLVLEGRRLAKVLFMETPDAATARTLARIDRIIGTGPRTSLEVIGARIDPVQDLTHELGIPGNSPERLAHMFRAAQDNGFDPAAATDRQSLMDALNRHRQADPGLWDGLKIASGSLLVRNPSDADARVYAQIHHIIGHVPPDRIGAEVSTPFEDLAKDVGLGYGHRYLPRMFHGAQEHGFDPAGATDRQALVDALNRYREQGPGLWAGHRLAERFRISDPSDATAHALARMEEILGPGQPRLDVLAGELGLNRRVDDLVRVYHSAQAHGFDPAGATDRQTFVDALNRHREMDPHVWTGQRIAERHGIDDPAEATARALGAIDDIVNPEHRHGIDDPDLLQRLAHDVGVGDSAENLARLYNEAQERGLDPASATGHQALADVLNRGRALDPDLWDGLRLADRHGMSGADDATARALGHMRRIAGYGTENGPWVLDPLRRLAHDAGLGFSVERLAHAYAEADRRGLAPAADRQGLVDRLKSAVPRSSMGADPPPDPGGHGMPLEEFRRAHAEALARAARGEHPIPYMIEDAIGGSGREFGLELEFDLPKGVTPDAIARALHAAGLAPDPYVHNANTSKADGYSRARNGWRVEDDASVAAEVVSPILHDHPDTWRDLQKVCKIIKDSGGTVTARTGGHIHVSTGDFRDAVENYNSLLRTVSENFDTLFRLMQSPELGENRVLNPCAPNEVPQGGFASAEEARHANGDHRYAVDMENMHGRPDDHAEYRMPDGSLDPAAIQTRVKVLLGVTDAAVRDASLPAADVMREDPGFHVVRGYPELGWQETASFRRLMDRIFSREVDRAQATALFAVTRWYGSAA